MSKPKSKSLNIPNAVPWYLEKKKVFIAIIISCLFLYGNSLTNKYALDDEVVIVKNELVQKGISGIPVLFKSNYDISGKEKYEYRPFTLTTFAIEYQFFKATPFISHLINLALYALGCCLLFNILYKIFNARYGIWLPLLAVAIFVFHPVHTEVVDNVKCRDELLVFVFGMLSWHIAYRFFKGGNYLNLLFFFIIGLIGMLSKRNGVIWIAMAPMIGYFISDKPDWKKMFICFFAATLCYFAFNNFSEYMVGSGTTREHLFFENPLYANNTLQNRTLMALYCFTFYIKLMLLPHPLVYFYGYNTIPFPSLLNVMVITGIFITAGLLFYTFKNFKNKTVELFGIAVFCVGLLPMLNIIEPAAGIVAERFVFSPSVGFCIVIAGLMLKYFKADIASQDIKLLPSKLKTTLLVILVLFSLKTFSRNQDWKNHFTLYLNDIEYVPESAKAHSLLAIEYRKEVMVNNKLTQQQKREFIDNAAFHFGKAIEIYPGYFTAVNNLGAIYYSFYGDVGKAQPLFEKAIKLRPEYFEAYYNLGRCYENKKEYEKAIGIYKKCRELQPETEMVYTDLIKLYLTIKQPDKAIKLNEDNLNKGLNDAFFYENLGNIYVTIGDTATAVKKYQEVLKLKPERQEVNYFVQNYLNTHKQN